jgi:hypothetical protein
VFSRTTAVHIEVVGVYEVPEAAQDCVLIELNVALGAEELDFSSVTQEIPGVPVPEWQVPWLEHELNDAGSSGQELRRRLVHGPVNRARVAFFFHYLDPSRPLLTPAGIIALPKATRRPDRLKFMRYESPC